MKCIAVDDEPLALKQICAYITKTPGLELLQSFDSSLDAQKYLLSDECEAELVFVDVNMPDLSGIDLIRSLIEPPVVIFTTAYSEYAVEGFKVGAADYILKPLSYEDFSRAVKKAVEVFEHKDEEKETESSEVASKKFVQNGKYIFVKSEYKIVRINFDDIKYIESLRAYVKFHLESRRPVISIMTIKTIENYLPKDRFMRVHRSFIVNLDKVTEVERLKVVFDAGTVVPVGEQYREQFEEFLFKSLAG